MAAWYTEYLVRTPIHECVRTSHNSYKTNGHVILWVTYRRLHVCLFYLVSPCGEKRKVVWQRSCISPPVWLRVRQTHVVQQFCVLETERDRHFGYWILDHSLRSCFTTVQCWQVVDRGGSLQLDVCVIIISRLLPHHTYAKRHYWNTTVKE